MLISIRFVSQFFPALLEIDSGGDTERHRGECRHDHDQQRADP